MVCGILKFIVSPAAKAELGALLVNGKETTIIGLTLQDTGHQQAATPVHCDNKTATGITNDIVKKHRSQSMEMHWFWVTDQVKRGILDVLWHPGAEHLADYLSKHRLGGHHKKIRPYCTHVPNLVRTSQRAHAPSTLRVCAGTLDHGYLKSVPLSKGPINGAEHFSALIGNLYQQYGHGFTMAIIVNNNRNTIKLSYVQQPIWQDHGPSAGH